MKNLAKIKSGFLLVVILILAGISQLKSQQDPHYGQYVFNNTIINPAQAGASDQLQIGGLVRLQWLGMEGAPRTQSLYANLRLPANLGLAAGIYQDKVGPERSFVFQLDLAYHLPIGKGWNWATGIRGSFHQTKISLANIQDVSPNDPLLQQDFSSGILANVGLGFLFYNKYSYIGVSMPGLLNKQAAFANSILGLDQFEIDMRTRKKQHYFVYAGTNRKIIPEIELLPSAMMKFTKSAPIQFDFNFLASYKNLVDFGPMVRVNLAKSDIFGTDALGFLIGVRVIQNLYFGYMYEYPMSSLVNGTSQTHEVSLRYSFNKKETRIWSPRYIL